MEHYGIRVNFWGRYTSLARLSRQHFATHNRTSTAVLYHSKKSRASLSGKLRTRCIYCEGVSENRGCAFMKAMCFLNYLIAVDILN